MKTGPYFDRSTNRSTQTPLCGRIPHMRAWIAVACLSLAACSSSPTAPTAPVAVTPTPVAVTPAPVTPTTPAPNPLLTDARFSLPFYRMLALGTQDLSGKTAPLRRHLKPIQFYVMNVDNQGKPIDARTLDMTAAALINTTPLWNGGMGIQGLTYGSAEPAPVGCLNCAPDPALEHNISVKWDATTSVNLCARSDVGGNTITVFLRTGGTCVCQGFAVAPVVIKHELGHVMGYWHTDNPLDVMGASGTATCDLNPSAREQFHARVAYSQPNGSRDPS